MIFFKINLIGLGYQREKSIYNKRNIPIFIILLNKYFINSNIIIIQLKYSTGKSRNENYLKEKFTSANAVKLFFEVENTNIFFTFTYY